MGRRAGRIRPETLLVLILAVLSAGIVSASVAVALDGFHQRSVGGPVAVLPDVLFSPAPVRESKVAPVTGEIQSEFDARQGSEGPDIELAAASPSPSPSIAPKTNPIQNAQPSPSSLTAMTLEFTQRLSGESNKKTITYTGRITNTGDVTLRDLLFRSHVPKQTTWNTDRSCGDDRLRVTIYYDGGGRKVECLSGGPSIKGTDDPNVHPVTVQLSEPLLPGTSIRIEFVVDVDADATGKVVNDGSHAEANGLKVDTGTAVTPLS